METLSPLESAEEHSPANTLNLARYDPFWTTDLQNCKIISVSGFK